MKRTYNIIDTTLREGEQNRGIWDLLEPASLRRSAYQLLQEEPSKAETVALESLHKRRHQPRHTTSS